MCKLPDRPGNGCSSSDYSILTLANEADNLLSKDLAFVPSDFSQPFTFAVSVDDEQCPVTSEIT